MKSYGYCGRWRVFYILWEISTDSFIFQHMFSSLPQQESNST